jgi:hypothetical protein
LPARHKNNLLPLLELNPDICSAIKRYACYNLYILTIELLAEYIIHHTILPEMTKKEMGEKSCNNQPVLSQKEIEKAILW